MNNRPGRVTINDVARVAGVSKGAVSRSMNGGERLHPDTVARVRAVAEELGWRPNAAARAVNGAPTRVLGFIALRRPEILDSDPFFASFLAGVESAAVDRDYSLLLRFARTQAEEERTYRDMIAERKVDGFIVVDLRCDDPRPALLKRLGAKAVVVGGPDADEHFSSIDIASDHAITAMVDHLVALGHTKFAHVSGIDGHRNSQHRAQVFVDALKSHGLSPLGIVSGGFTPDGGAQATRSLLSRAERPTAVFYANDIMALGGIAEMERTGCQIPSDISVVGFDGITLCNYARPRLSTIQCDYVTLGNSAAAMLFARLDGRAAPQREALPATLSLTESIGPAPQSSS